MTALRMTGMSMPRICAPVFLLAVLMSGICYWVNVELAPVAKTKIKRLFYDQMLDDPAMLFQPGKVLDDADIQELRVLLTRRDQHNQRLYRDITSLSTQLEQARSALNAGRMGRIRYFLQRLRSRFGR